MVGMLAGRENEGKCRVKTKWWPLEGSSEQIGLHAMDNHMDSSGCCRHGRWAMVRSLGHGFGISYGQGMLLALSFLIALKECIRSFVCCRHVSCTVWGRR